MERYVQYAVEQTCVLLAIDSPTGFTERAAERVRAELTTLGFAPEITRKGGVLVCRNSRRRMPCCWRPTRTPWGAWSPRSPMGAG